MLDIVVYPDPVLMHPAAPVEVFDEDLARLVAEMHETMINTSDLAPGVYFYNLRTNDEVLTKRMVVGK